MDIIAIILIISLAVVFAHAPFTRRLASFLDTLIHEAGHAVASLPFGAPLPSITVRRNTSGETISESGRIHSLLPFGLGAITEKIARLLSLLFGYSAPLIFASLLVLLSFKETIVLNSWFILACLTLALATVLWTAASALESPLSFIGVLTVASLLFVYFIGFSWPAIVSSFFIVIVLLLISRSLIALLAILTTSMSLIALILSFFLSKNTWLDSLINSMGDIDSSLTIAKVMLTLLFVFIIFCCRSWLALGLSILLLLPLALSTYQAFFPFAYVLLFYATIIAISGLRSFIELYKITKNQSTPLIMTDCVIASEELGGTPLVWYGVFLLTGIIVSIGVLVLMR